MFVLKSSFSCSDIHDGIAKALSEMESTPSPPPPVPSQVQSEEPSADTASLAQRKVNCAIILPLVQRHSSSWCIVYTVHFTLFVVLTGRFARKTCRREGARGRSEESGRPRRGAQEAGRRPQDAGCFGGIKEPPRTSCNKVNA